MGLVVDTDVRYGPSFFPLMIHWDRIRMQSRAATTGHSPGYSDVLWRMVTPCPIRSPLWDSNKALSEEEPQQYRSLQESVFGAGSDQTFSHLEQHRCSNWLLPLHLTVGASVALSDQLKFRITVIEPGVPNGFEGEDNCCHLSIEGLVLVAGLGFVVSLLRNTSRRIVQLLLVVPWAARRSILGIRILNITFPSTGVSGI